MKGLTNMAFDINKKDVIDIDPASGTGTCRFREKLVLSYGFKNLFSSQFHIDRSVLHIIAAILEKYPDGAAPMQLVTFNDVPLIVQEIGGTDYIFLRSETGFLQSELQKASIASLINNI